MPERPFHDLRLRPKKYPLTLLSSHHHHHHHLQHTLDTRMIHENMKYFHCKILKIKSCKLSLKIDDKRVALSLLCIMLVVCLNVTQQTKNYYAVFFRSISTTSSWNVCQKCLSYCWLLILRYCWRRWKIINTMALVRFQVDKIKKSCFVVINAMASSRWIDQNNWRSHVVVFHHIWWCVMKWRSKNAMTVEKCHMKLSWVSETFR